MDKISLPLQRIDGTPVKLNPTMLRPVGRAAVDLGAKRNAIAVNNALPVEQHENLEGGSLAHPCCHLKDENLMVQSSYRGNLSKCETYSQEIEYNENDGESWRESLSTATPQPADNWMMSYVDFVPRCLSSGSIIRKSKFETFGDLVISANKWLTVHPDVMLKHCELVDVPISYASVNQMGSLDSLKILRIWVMARGIDDDRDYPQLIGYVNVIPACLDCGNFQKRPTFDSLQTTVRKFNQLLSCHPLPGRVISMQSMYLAYEQWNAHLDPDICFVQRHAPFSMHYLQVLRLFYVSGASWHQSIGLKDFLNSDYNDLDEECVGELTSRAHRWLSINSHSQLINFQTIHSKMSNNTVSPDQCLVGVCSFQSRRWLPILRMFYLQSPVTCATQAVPPPYSCCLFLPNPSETSSLLMKRLRGWLLDNPNAEVISVETVPLGMESCPIRWIADAKAGFMLYLKIHI